MAILRSLGALLTLTVTASGVPGATFLTVESDPTDPIGGGAHLRLDSTTGAFAGYALVDATEGGLRARSVSLYATVGDPVARRSWYVMLSAPYTEYLGAGRTYEFSVDPLTGEPTAPTAPTDPRQPFPPIPKEPRFQIERDGRAPASGMCDAMVGQFTIRELALGAAGLRSLVAEVEAHCKNRKAGFRAALRFASGDPACDGRPDGVRCSDADGCTAGDACAQGRCVSGTPPACDDGDVRTDDVCSVTQEGCQHVPARSAWQVEGTTKVTAVGPGGSASRRGPFGALLILRADGTYAIPSSEPPCISVTEPYDETGKWTAARRGRLTLRMATRHELAFAIRLCSGFQGARVTGARQWVRIGTGASPPCPWAKGHGAGTVICGAFRTRLTVRTHGQQVTLVLASRFAGGRLDDGRYVPGKQ